MSQLQVVVEDEAWLIDKALYGFTRGTVLCMSHTLMWMSIRRQRERPWKRQYIDQLR